MKELMLKFGAAMFLFGAAVSTAQAASLGPINENTPPAICDKNQFVSHVRCIGGFCGSMLIQCDRAVRWARRDKAVWMNPISEEQGSQTCPANHAIAGFACTGSHCDNISILCVAVQFGFVNSCQGSDFSFTQWFSEEQDFPVPFSPNFVAVKMECKGSFCDDKRFWLCKPRLLN